jgi:carbon monoxide dehydrogenase subunit G
MIVEGQVIFDAPRETVWNLLLDPEALRAAIPGCESMAESGPDQYDAALKLGIAAIKGNYTAQVRVAEKRPPESYRLSISGSGGPGFVNVDGRLDLAPQDGKTAVDYRFDVQVGGMIAAVGQRMLGGVAKMMMGEFFKGLQKQLPGAAG